MKNGPLSEKDDRRWSVGVLEYCPDAAAQHAGQRKSEWVYRVSSPYVLVDAHFQVDVADGAGLQAETSVDDGHTWTPATAASASSVRWSAAPARLASTTHGQLNAVAGSYGYLLRVRAAKVKDTLSRVVIRSTFEVNPRTLPELLPGMNHYQLSKSNVERRELPVHAASAMKFAESSQHVIYQDDRGQGYLRNEDGYDGELIFAFDSNDDGSLQEVDAGGRFLNLSGGFAPNKLTAETGPVPRWPADPMAPLSGSIAWSTSEHGPWTTLWRLEDGKQPLGDDAKQLQTLQWPEVDRRITGLPQGKGPCLRAILVPQPCIGRCAFGYGASAKGLVHGADCNPLLDCRW